MTYEIALNLIVKYRQDRRFTSQYKEALAYFAARPQVIERLDPLLRTLIWPGGISCQTCKAQIPLVLSGIPLEAEKQTAFTRHLHNCPDCKLEYSELQKMGQDL